MGLLGLAEDTQHYIRGLGRPGRLSEDDCSAALVSDCPGSQEKIHRTRIHHCHVPVSHCGTSLPIDNAAHNLVADDTDSTGNTGPAVGSDLDQVLQIWIAVGLDFEDRCDGIALPLLVSLVTVARAPTFHPCFGPCLRTGYCPHYRDFLDHASSLHIRRIHSMAHWDFDIPAEAHVGGYH